VSSEQLSIEAPEFDRIKKEAGLSTRDGIQLLWQVANQEAKERRRGVRLAQEREQRKVYVYAQAADLHNFDWDALGTVVFTGASSVTLTGLRNGAQGDTVHLHVLGTGTVTLKHESASSDATNRLDTAADADVAVATGKTVCVQYLNSRWRQRVWA